MRIAHPYSGEAPGTSMAGEESQTGLYRALVDRCQSLEASQTRLREELDELVKEEKKIEKEEMEMVASDYGWGCLPGLFVTGNPYRKVLDCMGHAVHVCRASSGEIIYWYVCVCVSVAKRN
jgi:hypothetical protein